jgi:hypothetical protein
VLEQDRKCVVGHAPPAAGKYFPKNPIIQKAGRPV